MKNFNALMFNRATIFCFLSSLIFLFGYTLLKVYYLVADDILNSPLRTFHAFKTIFIINLAIFGIFYIIFRRFIFVVSYIYSVLCAILFVLNWFLMYKFRLVIGTETLDALLNTNYQELTEFIVDYVGFDGLAVAILLIFGFVFVYKKLFQKISIRGGAESLL